jgi:intracellular septation protein A
MKSFIFTMQIYTPLEKMLPKCPLTKHKKEQHSLRYIQYFFRAVTIIYIVTLKVGLFVLPNSLSLSLSLSTCLSLSLYDTYVWIQINVRYVYGKTALYFLLLHLLQRYFYFKLEEYIWVNFLNIWSSFFPLQTA